MFSSEQIQSTEISEETFSYFMQLCLLGLDSSDSAISSQVAIAIDYIFTYLFKKSENRHSGQELMAKLMQLLFFHDHSAQWTFTRALLPLILINKEVGFVFTTVFRVLYWAACSGSTP